MAWRASTVELRARLAALAACALALGCAAGAAAQPPVQAGERFELRVGEGARIEAAGTGPGESAVVELAAVASDSRCAVGVTCVWEGDAAVQVRLRAGAEPAQVLELHTAARGPRTAAAHGWRVELLGLEPQPVEGRATRPEEYRAALVVSRGGATGPER